MHISSIYIWKANGRWEAVTGWGMGGSRADGTRRFPVGGQGGCGLGMTSARYDGVFLLMSEGMQDLKLKVYCFLAESSAQCTLRSALSFTPMFHPGNRLRSPVARWSHACRDRWLVPKLPTDSLRKIVPSDANLPWGPRAGGALHALQMHPKEAWAPLCFLSWLWSRGRWGGGVDWNQRQGLCRLRSAMKEKICHLAWPVRSPLESGKDEAGIQKETEAENATRHSPAPDGWPHSGPQTFPPPTLHGHKTRLTFVLQKQVLLLCGTQS